MRSLTFTIATATLLAAGCSANPFYMGQQPTTLDRVTSTHLSEAHRASIGKVVVISSEKKPSLWIEGDFEKETMEVGDGAAKGAGAGVLVTGEMIAEDPRAIILAPIVLPFAIIAGSITGAAAAKIKQEVQEFRDELTTEIKEGSNRPLPSDVLAESLRSRLRNHSDIEVAIVDGDAATDDDVDAVLDIAVTNLTVMVEKSDAKMITKVSASLRRTKDDKVVFRQSYAFTQKDSLSNWAKDDYEEWAAYIDSAKRNLSREISADIFERILLRHVLRPVATNSATGFSTGDWSGRSKTTTPTLAWELFLLGGDSYGDWVEGIDADDAFFDLEIYDGPELVYSAKEIAESHHDVRNSLEACKNYRWSVRPVYRVDGKSRAGEWMRYSSSSFTSMQKDAFDPGSQQFWEGFPQLKTRC